MPETQDCCSKCNRPYSDVRLAPMLRDATWSQAANKDEPLCSGCFYERVAPLGVRITLADLLPCWWNRTHSPHSWFDLFSSGEAREAIQTWLNKCGFNLGPNSPDAAKPEDARRLLELRGP